MNCRKCQNKIPSYIKIDGILRNLCARKYCLECSPFGGRNTKANIDSVKVHPSESVKKFRYKLKQKAVDYKGGSCICCGYNACNQCLEFHHLDPKEKDFNIAAKMNSAFEALKKELDKCVLLCKNCHGEVHAGIRSLPQTTGSLARI